MQKKTDVLTYNFPVIGRVLSPFREKFGIPRQSGLAPCAKAQIEMLPPYNVPAAFDGLTACSHIWLQFVFHQSLHHQWRPKVRPPRLGGNASLGVFATRSPVRPSALGLSVVCLESIDCRSGVVLHIGGADLLDGTPVIDIKPYVPYVDNVASATNDIAASPPEIIPVIFCAEVLNSVQRYSDREYLEQLITEVLQQDPRPSYQKGLQEKGQDKQKKEGHRLYGTKICNFNLRWRYIEMNGQEVIEVVELIEV